MKNERIYKVLLLPHVSEKTAMINGDNQYSFKVASFANKLDVKNAVESLFKVKVNNVNMLNVKPKTKRTSKGAGKRCGWKKAYVTLEKGSVIELGQA